MSEMTARLGLETIAPGQAQKELSHNEALALLDLLVQPVVVAMPMNIPPDAPEPGQAWIVGTSPTGAWTGHAGALAGWTANGWRFAAPFAGMTAWIAEDAVIACYSGASWEVGVLQGNQVSIEGEVVVGARQAAIDDPDGGTMIDAEARTAVIAVLTALRAHGLIDI